MQCLVAPQSTIISHRRLSYETSLVVCLGGEHQGYYIQVTSKVVALGATQPTAVARSIDRWRGIITRGAATGSNDQQPRKAMMGVTKSRGQRSCDGRWAGLTGRRARHSSSLPPTSNESMLPSSSSSESSRHWSTIIADVPTVPYNTRWRRSPRGTDFAPRPPRRVMRRKCTLSLCRFSLTHCQSVWQFHSHVPDHSVPRISVFRRSLNPTTSGSTPRQHTHV